MTNPGAGGDTHAAVAPSSAALDVKRAFDPLPLDDCATLPPEPELEAVAPLPDPSTELRIEPSPRLMLGTRPPTSVVPFDELLAEAGLEEGAEDASPESVSTVGLGVGLIELEAASLTEEVPPPAPPRVTPRGPSEIAIPAGELLWSFVVVVASLETCTAAGEGLGFAEAAAGDTDGLAGASLEDAIVVAAGCPPPKRPDRRPGINPGAAEEVVVVVEVGVGVDTCAAEGASVRVEMIDEDLAESEEAAEAADSEAANLTEAMEALASDATLERLSSLSTLETLSTLATLALEMLARAAGANDVEVCPPPRSMVRIPGMVTPSPSPPPPAPPAARLSLLLIWLSLPNDRTLLEPGTACERP